MKARLVLLALAIAPLGFGQYTYDFSCAFANFEQQACNYLPINGSTFAHNGGGVAMIYTSSLSGNANDYEVDTQLMISGYSGLLAHMLRADTSALNGGFAHGNYISAQLGIPTNFQLPGPATLSIMQCINGNVTQLASTNITATDGMILRSVIWGTNLWVFVNNVRVVAVTVPSTSGALAGIGESLSVVGAAAFTSLKVGHRDATAPNPVSAQGIATSVFPTAVSVKWPAALDDQNGIGVWQYSLTSSAGTVTSTADQAFTDTTVAPSTTYSYTLQATDFHGNQSTQTTFNVTTPPASSIDPRRIGLPSTGSFWGGGGEQIDTLSGNVNFSIPLVTPRGRAGWTMPLALTYNSQNWRLDNGVNWMLGNDVGYGFGWRLSFGSITPYYTTAWSGVDHYVFTDSSGAEYRLGQNSGGVWSSTQGIYVWFDANTNLLHFKNGMFWVMGSVSGGGEPDAGTMYPTIIEDVSGNQVIINYQPGAQLAGQMNTSARINGIEDVRSGQGCVASQNYIPNTMNCPAYSFTYNSDYPTPHLTAISNRLQTAENYGFGFSSSVTIQPPFGADANYDNVQKKLLTSVTPTMLNAYTLAYDTAGAGELTQVTFPFGGHLRWAYVNDAFAGARTLRAVGNRYLAADSAGATEWSYPITRDNAAGATLHATTSLVDASGVGSKTWNFFTGPGTPAWELGFLSQLLQKPSLTSSAILQDDTYTWSQEPTSGNVYISAKTTVMDEGSTNQQSALATQTIDQYGNVTQALVYPYNNTTTPLQTYTNSYLNDAIHTQLYIFDRLVGSQLTTAAGQKTLVTNTYDQQGITTINGQAFVYGRGNVSPLPYADIDASAMPWGSRGILTQTTTPAHTVYFQTIYGAVSGSGPTDGQITIATPGSSTNYAAPQTIATQTFSQNVSYNSWLGITQTTTINGEALSTTYDAYGRPTASRDAISNYYYSLTGNYPPTYTYTYSAQNTLPETQTRTGFDGVTVTTLDGLGHVIRVSRGDTNGAQSYVDTVYAPCACSPLGKLQQVSQPYAPNGTPVWTVYTYDGVGRALTVRQPDGASTTTYAYSGNQTTVTDPGTTIDPVAPHNAVPIWKKFTKDALGNLTSVTEPDPMAPSTGTLTTTYAYDWMNHVAGVSMTRGSTRQTRTFVYNDAGLLTAATNPENGTVLYYYNADNTLHYKHDGRGQETVYAYDTYQRVTNIQHFPAGQSNPVDACQTVWYEYGTSTNDPSHYPASYGRVIGLAYGSVDGSGNSCIPGVPATSYQESFTYWPYGKLWTKTLSAYRSSANTIGTVSYSWGPGGLLYNTQYSGIMPFALSPSYINLSYGFDSMSRPTSLLSTSGTLVQGVQYDAASRITQMQYMAGAPGGTLAYTTETMSYNANGQMVTQSWSTPSSLGPTGGLAYSFASGQNNGQITQVSDTVSGETIVYQYDALKRLTSASSSPQTGSSTQPYAETLQFDGFGNLTAKVLNNNTTSIPVNAATNQLSNASYDLNGNMTSGVGATLAYDGSNRLSSAAEVSGGIEYYGYTPDNKRMYKLDKNGLEEWTFYGAFGEKLGVFQYSASAVAFVPVRSTITFAGQAVVDDGNAVFRDRLGTNRANGARYYPYGDEITSTSNDRVKFATYMRDSYTGLDYADQRFYASTYGRFITPDFGAPSNAKTIPLNWNRYSYVGGDPINKTDPRGMCSPDDDPPCYSTTGYGEPDPPDDEDDSDVAFPQISRGASPSQQVIEWLALVQKRVTTATTRALKALQKPDCAKLFGIDDPSSLLSDLIKNDTTVGGIKSPPGTTISATTQGTTLVTANGTFNGAEIKINDVAGAFVTGTLNDQIVTLLHELGHAVNFIYGDGTSQIVNDGTALGQAGIQASMNNTALVQKNCLH